MPSVAQWDWFWLILAMWSIGKSGRSLLIKYLLENRNNNLYVERFFMMGVFFMSAGFIFLFHQGSRAALMPFAWWAGLGDGASEVSLLSRLQNEPDETRLPISSLLILMQKAGFGIGVLFISPFFVCCPHGCGQPVSWYTSWYSASSLTQEGYLFINKGWSDYLQGWCLEKSARQISWGASVLGNWSTCDAKQPHSWHTMTL